MSEGRVCVCMCIMIPKLRAVFCLRLVFFEGQVYAQNVP